MALRTLSPSATAAELAGESGQDTLEWTGLLALVAVLITLLLAVGIPTAIAHSATCSVETVLQIGDCSPDAQTRSWGGLKTYGGPIESGHPAGQQIWPPGGWPTLPNPNPGNIKLPFRDGYSYHYTISGSGGQTSPSAAMSYLSQHFGSGFGFPSNCTQLQVGETCNLQVAGVTAGPVRVVAVGPTSFELESLPGHPEGPWRYITFSFSRDSSGQLQMSVSAQGPATVGSEATLRSGLGWAIWWTFAQKLGQELPP